MTTVMPSDSNPKGHMTLRPPVANGTDTRPAVAGLLRDAVARLARAGVPSPEADAELLLGHVLRIGRGEVRARAITGAAIEPSHASEFELVLDRRCAREPLQYITGVAHFRSLELAVGPGVFVPRPETEEVARLAIEELRRAPQGALAVDLGTGSGAIALALATEVPTATVIGVENSTRAYIWARRNFAHADAANARIVFDDLETCLPDAAGTASVVVSNPPYIPTGMVPRDPEVRLFDPHAALYGGDDGLDIVRHVAATAWRLLAPGGLVVIEHGELQQDAIVALLDDGGFADVAGHVDLTGRPRATTARR